jgi:hypothetical protein
MADPMINLAGIEIPSTDPTFLAALVDTSIVSLGAFQIILWAISVEIGLHLACKIPPQSAALPAVQEAGRLSSTNSTFRVPSRHAATAPKWSLPQPNNITRTVTAGRGLLPPGR